MNAANLARESLDVLEHYLSMALLVGVQAVELRAKLTADSYDARAVLSEGTAKLYVAAREAASGAPQADRPIHWNDLEAFIQPKVEGILDSVSSGGAVMEAIAPVRQALASFASRG